MPDTARFKTGIGARLTVKRPRGARPRLQTGHGRAHSAFQCHRSCRLKISGAPSRSSTVNTRFCPRLPHMRYLKGMSDDLSVMRRLFATALAAAAGTESRLRSGLTAEHPLGRLKADLVATEYEAWQKRRPCGRPRRYVYFWADASGSTSIATSMRPWSNECRSGDHRSPTPCRQQGHRRAWSDGYGVESAQEAGHAPGTAA